MFKKSYLKLLLVAVLLLTTVLSFGILSQAASAEYNIITVDYDSGCVGVKVYYNDGFKVVEDSLQSGVPVQIGKGTVNVKLELVLHDGYDVESATDGTVTYFKPGDLVYDFGVSLTSSKTIVVKTQPKVYDIEYIRTTPEGTANTDGAPLTHTYNTVTKIPNPTLTGYNFVQWLILPAHPDSIANFNPANYNDVLRPGNRDSVDLSETKFPGDAAGKTFYLYPIWTPKTYPVYVRDVIYTGSVEYPVGSFLNGSEPYLVGNYPAGTPISGVDISREINNLYTGYYFDEAQTLASTQGNITVMAYETDGEGRNIVFRFYTPHKYKLDFGCSINGDTVPTLPEGSAAYPEFHVFNQNTTIPSPILTGYNFAGWQVEIYDGTAWKDVSTALSGNSFLANTQQLHSEPFPDQSGERIIRLTARWTPKTFDITYDWAGAVNVGFPTEDYDVYTFNADLVIPDPIRVGYTFLGWTLNSGDYVDQQIDSVNGSTTLASNTYLSTISLTARWQANVYNVTFNANGAEDGWNPPSVSVTFDQPFVLPSDFAFPTRIGNDFIGFSLDAEGKQMYTDAQGKPLSEFWTVASDSVLYAQWERRNYTVSVVDPNGLLPENATVTVNGMDYTGTPLPFKYGDAITVTVTVKKDGDAFRSYKIVQWKGTDDSAPQGVTHAYSYTYTFTLGADDEELACVIAPIVAVPEFKVDYLNEALTAVDGTLPDGKYLISYGQVSLTVEVTDGKIVITEEGNSKQYSAVPLKDSAFGAQMQITVCGNGTTTADAAAILLTVAPRPAAPTLNVPGSAIDRVYQHEDTKIIIQMTLPADLSLYEFAVSESNAIESVTRWYLASELAQPSQGAVMFEKLKPGTQYYVFVRIKAVDGNSPHGDSNAVPQATNSNTTLTAKKNELTDMILPSDGEMLKNLINQAIAELDALAAEGPTTDFESKLNAILAKVSDSQLAYARKQDSLIAELTLLYTSLANSNQFSDKGLTELNAYYTVAVSGIQSATAADVAQSAYDVGRTKMLLLPITHLYDGNLHLISQNGLPQGVTLSQLRFDEISDLIAAVKVSMESNTVAVNGSFMTLEQAQELLDSLELLASYSMELQQNGVSYTMYDGVYEIRLLLPADLLEQTGLQVGYFDEKTGVVTLLETKREGHELVFYANTVEDFMILGDSTIELTGFLIALSIILMLQLAAIIVLLVRRKKNSELVRMNGFAPIPAIMAVRFLPESSLTWLLILSALVVILQVVLIYLLITSDLFHRREIGRGRSPSGKRSAEPEFEEPLATDEQTEYQDAPIAEDAYDVQDTDGESYPVEDGKAYDEAFLPEEAAAMLIFDEQVEEEIDAQTEDVDSVSDAFDPEFDSEDFIEPAPNPYYSLEEEPMEDASEEMPYDGEYAPEETESLESVEAWENAETDAWSEGDADPMDAVFAEETADAQGWQCDPETGEVFEYSEPAEDEDAFADLPEEEMLAEETEAILAEEAAVEMLEDEIYVEDDIVGDEAPAPEIYFDEQDAFEESEDEESDESEASEKDDSEQQYNGYEE